MPRNVLLLTLIAALSAGTLRAAPQAETLLQVIPEKDKHQRYGEGDLVELKDGRLCVIYTRHSGPDGWHDANPANIMMRTSSDAGKTWTDERVLVKREEGKLNVMSVSILRLKSGELLLFYHRKNSRQDLRQYVRRSNDEFKTLGEPVRVSLVEGYNCGCNDRALLLSTGRILVPCTVSSVPNRPGQWSIVYISDDQAQTWRVNKQFSNEQPLKPYWIEPSLVELKDGRIWALSRSNGDRLLQSYSSDQGETWTELKPSQFLSGISPPIIERIPWTGDLMLVWNDQSGYHALPRSIRSPLCLTISNDEGKTWSKPRVLEAAPPQDGWRSVWLSYYTYASVSFVKDRAILSYWDMEAPTKRFRMYGYKVIALPREWLYWD